MMTFSDSSNDVRPYAQVLSVSEKNCTDDLGKKSAKLTFTDEEKISLADVMIETAQGNEEYLEKLRSVANAATLCQLFSASLNSAIMNIPTPKTLYPRGHDNFKYRMLNSLNQDVMARDDENGPKN